MSGKEAIEAGISDLFHQNQIFYQNLPRVNNKIDEAGKNPVNRMYKFGAVKGISFSFKKNKG